MRRRGSERVHISEEGREREKGCMGGGMYMYMYMYRVRALRKYGIDPERQSVWD